MNKIVKQALITMIAISIAIGSYFNAEVTSEAGALNLPATNKTYYVSINGSDANSGNNTAPYKTFAKAISVLAPGDVIHIIGTIPAINVTKADIIIEGGIVDGVSNKSADSSTVLISASNVTIRNVEIINGWSYGIRTGSGKGDGLVLDNVSIHNNVLENKIGNKCSATSTSGWGSAFRAYYSSNITVKNSRIYDNCGEGFSSIMSKNVTGTNLEVYDNFSVNIYPDQTQNFTVTDSVISCIKPEYQRLTLSRSLLLGAESYSGISTNMLDGVIFERNKIYNCKGVGTYSETGGNWKNIHIVNNDFYNVPVPALVTIPGTNIVTSPNTITSASSSLTPTKTSIPVTITSTALNTVAATLTPVTITSTKTVTLSATLPAVNPTNTVTTPLNPPIGQNSVDIRISDGNNDVEESASGWMYLDSTDLELVYDSNSQIVGLRFVGVNIPQGAIITNAYIQFKVDETSSTTVNLFIRGDLSANSPTFTSKTQNVSTRLKTTNVIAWSPTSWSTIGAVQRTPNLAPVIQELISQAGWISGNSLSIIINGASSKRVAVSFEGDAAGAPLLHIEYNTTNVLSLFSTISSPTVTLSPMPIASTPTATIPLPSPSLPAPTIQAVTPTETSSPILSSPTIEIIIPTETPTP